MVLNENQDVLKIGTIKTNEQQKDLKKAFTEKSNLSDDMLPSANKTTTEQAIDNQGTSDEINNALANAKTIDDLLSENTPTNWIIKKYIPTQSIIMLHGESGAGKTFVALDMTLSIAYGICDWFGYKIKKKYNVLYFSGEGNNAIGKRVKAFQQERELQGQTGNFILCDNSIPLMVNGKTNKDIITFIKMLPFKPDLIVFDTVNIFMNEGDENSNTDCGRFMDTIRELNREFNCTTLLIHHTGKDQNQKSNPRGASAIRAAVDIEISILIQKDNVIKIMQTKNKDAEIQEPFHLKKEIVNLKNTFDEDGIQETSIILKPVNKAQDKEIATIQKQKENLKKIILYHEQSVIINGLNEQREIQLTRKNLEEYFEQPFLNYKDAKIQTRVFLSRDITPLVKANLIHKIGTAENCILSISDNEWTNILLNEINIETDIEFQ